jgi:AmiR/NasT family two-component response regulator
MSNDISKGGYTGPVRKRENVNILLIGSPSSDAELMKKEMGLITGLSYTAWYCVDIEEAMDFIADGHEIEIIFLDLSLFNADYPKERFLQVKKNLPDVPIIVLTDRTDYDLIHFVMEEGAADNVSRWQIRGDSDRLRNIVESCCSRDKISKKERQVNQDALDRSGMDLRDEHDKSDAVLSRVQEQHALAMGIINDENAQLRMSSSQSHTDLLEEHHKNSVSRQEAQDKGDILLKETQAKDVAVLLVATNENTQLRRDLFQSGIDLADANFKSDAVLKYAQEKGAIELKKMKDENTELMKELSVAKEWLSGGYSLQPPKEE